MAPGETDYINSSRRLVSVTRAASADSMQSMDWQHCHQCGPTASDCSLFQTFECPSKPVLRVFYSVTLSVRGSDSSKEYVL